MDTSDQCSCTCSTVSSTVSCHLAPPLQVSTNMFSAAWQTTVYWYMGSLTNNSRKLANFAGFYKGIQSAGGAAAFGINNTTPTYKAEFFANWGLLLAGLIFAAPVIFTKIRDTVPLEEDLQFTDETAADVKGIDTEAIVH
jgi:hypothetical protein